MWAASAFPLLITQVIRIKKKLRHHPVFGTICALAGKISYMWQAADTSMKPEYEKGIYSFRNQRKVFFAASSGVCNLRCTYCITNRPTANPSLTKKDFAFIFDYFGENIYFIFSGVGDFFCGYREEEYLLRYLLKHDIRMYLDINAIDIKELGRDDLEGRDKIDMIDISFHYVAMKRQKLLERWLRSVNKIHEAGHDYYIKFIPVESEEAYGTRL